MILLKCSNSEGFYAFWWWQVIHSEKVNPTSEANTIMKHVHALRLKVLTAFMMVFVFLKLGSGMMIYLQCRIYDVEVMALFTWFGIFCLNSLPDFHLFQPVTRQLRSPRKLRYCWVGLLWSYTYWVTWMFFLPNADVVDGECRRMSMCHVLFIIIKL